MSSRFKSDTGDFERIHCQSECQCKHFAQGDEGTARCGASTACRVADHIVHPTRLPVQVRDDADRSRLSGPHFELHLEAPFSRPVRHIEEANTATSSSGAPSSTAATEKTRPNLSNTEVYLLHLAGLS